MQRESAEAVLNSGHASPIMSCQPYATTDVWGGRAGEHAKQHKLVRSSEQHTQKSAGYKQATRRSCLPAVASAEIMLRIDWIDTRYYL